MRYSFKNGLFWIFIYILLGLLPMGIAIAGDIPEFRTFWIEFGVALGFIGLSMFALQFIFSGRITQIPPRFGSDNILNFHRQLGITAFFLILAHPIILILAEPEFISYFDPRVNLPRALALSVATVSIILISATSVWRGSFKLSYEYWRLLHGLLAMAIVFIGVVHAIQVSHYLEPLWKQITLAILMGGTLYLVIHTRLVRPWLISKKPYKVKNVKQEIGESWSLTMKPEGHHKMNFEPGQFAWITLGPTPFSLQQHPFTFASSPNDDTITFTAKESGDFTSTWKDIEPGTKAWLEGPSGSFMPYGEMNLFFIMGGIGITPAMSMLRTMRDNGDPKKAILIYANTEWDDVTFRKELEKLSNEINLKVIHVLEETPEDWEGEEGLVDEELLKKYLPDEPHEFIYFLCGPEPLMDTASIALHDLGIKWNHIYMERFQIV